MFDIPLYASEPSEASERQLLDFAGKFASGQRLILVVAKGGMVWLEIEVRVTACTVRPGMAPVLERFAGALATTTLFPGTTLAYLPNPNDIKHLAMA